MILDGIYEDWKTNSQAQKLGVGWDTMVMDYGTDMELRYIGW